MLLIISFSIMIFLSCRNINKTQIKDKSYLIDCYLLRLQFENSTDKQLEELKEKYIQSLEIKFRNLTPKIVDYKTSKTDERISTIRHGFNLLIRNKEWEKLKRDIIREKDYCNIDNDYFVLVKESETDFRRVLVIIGAANNEFIQIVNADKFKPDTEFLTKGIFNLITE